MKSPLLLSLALLLLTAPIATGEQVIDQVSFPPGCGCRPSVAVSQGDYTAVAYITEQPGYPDPQVAVQMVPTVPEPDEIWPDPVYFGAGSEPAICWSRDGFTLAYVGPSGDAALVHQADHEGVWDPGNVATFQPGGEVTNLDLWGDPADAAGHAVFLVIDEDIDPDLDDSRIHFASRSSESGWTPLELLVAGLHDFDTAQVTWQPGPSGPRPRVFFLDGFSHNPDLYWIYRSDAGWSAPNHVPGDGASGPTTITGDFDVARATEVGVVGLGPYSIHPTGTIFFLCTDGFGGWLPEEQITVHHDLYNYPRSPSIDVGGDQVMHLFWRQLTSNDIFEPPLYHTLEYWTYDGGTWTDRGAFLDDMDSGIGPRVDVGVTLGGEHAVLAWSRTDTIDGEPQLEQVFMARCANPLAAPLSGLPQAAVKLAAWPNPFNPRVNLAVTLPSPASATLDIYDARGRHLRRLHDGMLRAGRHEFAWDGTLGSSRRAPSGIYFARAATGAGNEVRKLVLTE